MWRVILAFLFIEAAIAGVVSDVRILLARGGFQQAEKRVSDEQARNPADPEIPEAFSWLARAAFDSGRLDQAYSYASAARKAALPKLKTAPPEIAHSLEIALGASIEVEAGVTAKRGDRAGAVAFLNRELKTWWNTPLRTRIQKNLNLLSMAGKPAPHLDVSHWLGPKPQALDGLKGRPVLLFFWAHWCGDCKADVPVVAKVMREYGPLGLVVLGPTQEYGYAAGGEDTGPEEEARYIDRVRREFYSALGEMPVPLSRENFRNYGASTVPTLVLIDKGGIVRLYHPGAMSYEELAASVSAVVGNQQKAAGHH